jgi:cell division protein FtsB
MSSAIGSASGYAGSNEGAILKARKKGLPPCAQKKLKYFESLEMESRALANVKAEKRQAIRETLHRTEDLIVQTERQKAERWKGWSRQHESELDKLKAEVVELKNEIAQFNKPPVSPLSSRDKSKRAVIARLGSPINDWLMGLTSGQRFRGFAPAELKLRKGQSLTEALEENRAAQNDFAEQVVLAERAPLDLQTAIYGMKRDVARLAKLGEPDVADVLRYRVANQRGDKAQGHVKWPTERHPILSHMTYRDFQLGSSMLAWLCRDAIEAKLEAMIRARFDPNSAMTVEKRNLRVKECEGKILELQRIEEQLVLQLESQGTKMRIFGRSPLALLEIEPAN